MVLFIFLGASVLQGLSPIVMQQMNAHHHGEVMACSMDGDCDSSCAVDGEKACSCNHTASDDDSNSTKLCGCDHHGSAPIGTNAPFQIKAPLVSAFDGITFSPKTVFLRLKQYTLFIFTDDIFHPPRLLA
ncbi:MAG: hypothetical protein GWN62_02375 [Aliifodinibius sp.]|nr:hypothetical protein [Fodinibius sp.]